MAQNAVAERVHKWLGELPSGWRGARLLEVSDAWTSNVDKHTVEGQPPVRLCNYVDVYQNDSIVDSLDFMVATATREQIKRFRVRVGDTLITKDSETADDIGIPAFVEYEAKDLICGYHLAIVRPDRRKAVPKFLYWVLRSEPIARQWGVTAAGVTRVGIRSTDLNKVTIPLPPLDEQSAVAGFLDYETAQIDALVAKQEELLTLLAERRRSVLDRVLSEVGGERRRLRWLYRSSSVANKPNEEVLSVYRDHGVIPKASRSDNFNKTPENVDRYLLVRPHDLVVNKMKAWQGSLGVSAHRGIVSGDYEVLRPTTLDLDPDFAHFILRSPELILEYRVRSRGIRPSQWRLYWQDLADISVAVPPLAEQRSAASRIKTETDAIDSLIAQAREHIAFAKERRSALITAAVTGQIDVRTAWTAG
ncbi:type I restriction enzyme S subunit [Nocardia fluminea]|uniref:Type I restriction enzyme S subunit n=1 Tax=Nocardia fluminea TaxID=134984 RepID=A0A2N3VFR9_9NOCA|nr:type I restriction enzyme S subunit [Nocardia fluminea]